MGFVQLVASGGDMTVGRRTAAYVYGSRAVTLPEGYQDTGKDDNLVDGYIYRPEGMPTGRFDFAWVRADVSVDAGDGRGHGRSDMEKVLDSTLKRVDGDVFFERDIEGAGLGLFTPGVDFTTGDVVGVRIWGRVLDLPVTACDMLADKQGVRWRVHVGGQLITDAETLRSHNDQIKQALEADRKKLAKDVKHVKSTAARAESTANSASRVAEGAETKAAEAMKKAASATSVVDDALSKAKDAQAKATAANLTTEEGKQIAIAANITATQANSKAIAAVDAANKATRQIAETNRTAIAANNKADETRDKMLRRMPTLVAGNIEGKTLETDLFIVDRDTPLIGAHSAKITIKPGWEGVIHALTKANNGAVDVHTAAANGREQTITWSPRANLGYTDVFITYYRTD